MTREEAVRSIEAGIEIVEELLEKEKIDMLGTGDMGIGNTTPSSAVIAAFSGIPVEKLTGRGTGIDDKMLKHKIEVIEKGLEINKPDKNDGLRCARESGRFRDRRARRPCARRRCSRIPVVCDGLISTAGALIACSIAPKAKEYLFASHRSV